jgi:hypothetical protein
MVETSSPSRWGCRSSGRRQRSEAGARIPRVEGRCRNVARAITTHRFGLWAVLEAGWITAHPEVHRARSASHGPEDLLNRHSIGSILASLGEHQLTICDYLRHSNLNVTSQYLQATSKTKRLARGRLVDPILPTLVQ